MNSKIFIFSIIVIFSLCPFYQALSMLPHQANANNMKINYIKRVKENQLVQEIEKFIQNFERECIQHIIPLQEQIHSATSYQELSEISESLLNAMYTTYNNSIINMKFSNSFEPYLLAVFGEAVQTEIKKITNFYQSISTANVSAQKLIELVNEFVANLPTQLKSLLKLYRKHQLSEIKLKDVLMATIETLTISTKFSLNHFISCDTTNPQSIANCIIEARYQVLKIPFFLNWTLQHIVALMSTKQEMQEYFFEALEQANQEFNTNLYGSLDELQAGINKLCEIRLQVACNWLEMLP